MSTFSDIILSFEAKHILVIGDIILDQYIQGNVSRISPEAPVPVVFQEKSFYTPGGSANVAHNLSSLGAKVTMVGKIGQDREGEDLLNLLQERGVDTSGIFKDATMPTALKTRIIAQHQQVVRVDREKVDFSNTNMNAEIEKFIENSIDSFDAIIISDYGKGVVTSSLVEKICSLAHTKNKILTVDPKVENFNYYRNVTAITPNKKEAENAIRFIKVQQKDAHDLAVNSDRLQTDEQINCAGEALLNYLKLESLLVTLGEHGMRLFEQGQKPFSIQTKAREVFDVSGAGDTVISVFTLALTAGATKKQAAELSNMAAGIVVGKMGAVAIQKKELLDEAREVH